MKPEEMFNSYASMEANFLTWLGIHGNLCLALRHPQNVGVSRTYIVAFVKRLGRKLVEWGVITEELLRDIERVEIEEGNVDLESMEG